MDKKYTLSAEFKYNETEHGYRQHMKRSNDGFSGYEVIGILEEAKQDVLNQLAGQIKPDIIKREAVEEEDNE